MDRVCHDLSKQDLAIRSVAFDKWLEDSQRFWATVTVVSCLTR